MSADVTADMAQAFSVIQGGVEVVQDPELGKDDRAFRIAIEALDLAVLEFEHVAARCIHFLSGGTQFAKRKLQWTIVEAL